jgi:hypothetical protein
MFGTKCWSPINNIYLELSWKLELPSLRLSKVKKIPQMSFLNVIFYSCLTFFTSFL